MQFRKGFFYFNHQFSHLLPLAKPPHFLLSLLVCFPHACMRIIQPFSKLETLPEKESYLLGLKRLDFNSTLGSEETLGCLHLPLQKESHKNAAVVNI